MMATSLQGEQTPPVEKKKMCSSMLLPMGFRMVLVGKTGTGKSASGNTILGRVEFKVDCSAASVTRHCSTGTEEMVTVIDTPGLFDTQLSESSVRTQLVECITLSSPGPHVFLLVMAVGRFTEEEQKSLARVKSIFGEAAVKHTMVLFTHRDKLEGQTIEDFIRRGGPDLQHLVQECGNRFHVFENDNTEDREQVNELMRKVTAMVEENEGQYYTNDMYQQVEGAIRRRERELRRRYEHEQRRKENLESELERLLEKLDIKDMDLRKKQREIDDLNARVKQIRKDKDLLKKKREKAREQAEKDFDKKRIVQIFTNHVTSVRKSFACTTQ